MAKCKITVLKKFYDEEIAKKYVKDYDPEKPVHCPFFEEGQEFLIDENLEMPEGFCAAAWAVAIDKFAFALVNGAGGFFQDSWMEHENQIVTCCYDGVRPVAFLLERIDDK